MAVLKCLSLYQNHIVCLKIVIMLLRTFVLLFLCVLLVVPSWCDEKAQPFISPVKVDCNTLRLGQYLCPDPAYDFIDPKTQQIRGCTKENKAKSLFNLYLVGQVLISLFFSFLLGC